MRPPLTLDIVTLVPLAGIDSEMPPTPPSLYWNLDDDDDRGAAEEPEISCCCWSWGAAGCPAVVCCGIMTESFSLDSVRRKCVRRKDACVEGLMNRDDK